MYKMLIKEYRKEMNLSQRELSEKSGVSKSYISELEKAKYDATCTIIIQICLALKISPNELLNWDEIKTHKIEDIMTYLNNN